MEDKKELVEALFERIKEYLNTSIEIIKLKSVEKAAEIFSTLAVKLSILAIASIFMLFLNIGIAFWLGEILGKVYYGFLIVAAFYLAVTLIILLLSKKIKKSIADSIITNALK